MGYFGNIVKALFNNLPEPAEAIIEEKQALIEVPPCDCAEKLRDLVKNEADLRTSITELKKERDKLKDSLSDDLRKANEALAKVKLEHKHAIEDIKHMHKKLEEKAALEKDRAIFEAEKTAEKDIKEIRRIYADKLEKELQGERRQMQDFMQRVMAALPNVNVALGTEFSKKEG